MTQHLHKGALARTLFANNKHKPVYCYLARVLQWTSFLICIVAIINDFVAKLYIFFETNLFEHIFFLIFKKKSGWLAVDNQLN